LLEHTVTGFLIVLVNKYNRTLGEASVEGRFCVFAGNKYNRTLGEAFVEGRFCVFAGNPRNRGSDLL
jgi:hypothetical protein